MYFKQHGSIVKREVNYKRKNYKRKVKNMSTTYGFTNKYLTKDEKPWFPVMGEIHFSR